MAELKIYISDGLNQKFRRIAMKVHGYGRGSLSKAAEEALTKWCTEHEQPSVSTKKIDGSEAAHDEPKEIETHINPDERVSAGQEGTRIVENGTGSQTSAIT